MGTETLVGSGQWAVGSGQLAVGSRQLAVGNRQWAVGSCSISGSRGLLAEFLFLHQPMFGS